MTLTKEPQHIPVPENARFVVYLLPGVKYTLQKTLLCEADKMSQQMVPRTWKDIKEADLGGYSYGVKFKDDKNQELPNIYITRGVGNVQDIYDEHDEGEYNIDADLKQAEISNALVHMGLTTYVAAQLKDVLIYVAFDPETMILVAEEGK